MRNDSPAEPTGSRKEDRVKTGVSHQQHGQAAHCVVSFWQPTTTPNALHLLIANDLSKNKGDFFLLFIKRRWDLRKGELSASSELVYQAAWLLIQHAAAS